MTLHRSGEQGALPVRNGRFLQKENYWYYTTREGVDIGPFDTIDDAEVGASDFIDFICGAEPAFIHTLEQYGRAVA